MPREITGCRRLNHATTTVPVPCLTVQSSDAMHYTTQLLPRAHMLIILLTATACQSTSVSPCNRPGFDTRYQPSADTSFAVDLELDTNFLNSSQCASTKASVPCGSSNVVPLSARKQ